MNNNVQHLTATEKWTYAIGNNPFTVEDAAYINFVVFYYTQVQGLSRNSPRSPAGNRKLR